jgi:hypothetical protein
MRGHNGHQEFSQLRENGELQRLFAGFSGNLAENPAHFCRSGTRTSTRMPDFAGIFARRTRESGKPDTRPKSLGLTRGA